MKPNITWLRVIRQWGAPSLGSAHLGRVAILCSAKDKFAGSEFGQPQAGPQGEVQGWTSHKVTKRKAIQMACPLTWVPCASHWFGRSPNSQDLPRLRLANPAQTGRLAYSQTGCDARLRLWVSNPPLVEAWSALLSAILSCHHRESRDPVTFCHGE